MTSPAATSPLRAPTAFRLVPRSFRGTIVLSTVALMAGAMLAVGLGLQFVLDFTAQRDISQVLADRSSAMISVIQQASGKHLAVPTDTLEPGMEVFNSNGVLIAGTVEKRVREAAASLGSAATQRTMRGPRDEVRLLATPFRTPSGERGVLVVSQETAPYERSEFYALLATITLGILVIAITALTALRVTRQALAPVTQMAERAADWSEHDLSHRFDLGPPTNELAALGETLDHLLDRVGSAIMSEQRLTSELAHELRTPLTSIQGSADLALMRGVDDPEARRDFEQIAASSREMSGVIATLLDIARDGATRDREQTCQVSDVVAALRSAVPDGVELDDDTHRSSARIAAPAALVARAVTPLVENAARHARGRIALRAVDRRDRVELRVADDGPGVADEVRDRIFDPGVTLSPGGAGLGLGIARRVARSFGGDIDLAAPDLPAAGVPAGQPAAQPAGATFVVTLPRR